MERDDRQSSVVATKSYTAVAISTAAKAGEWIRRKFGSAITVQTKRSWQDLVTEVDQGAEKLIRNYILTYFPDHVFWGEESVYASSTTAMTDFTAQEYVWIVDPIDGTTNFVHELPMYTISIALAHRGEVIVGVVYDPMRDEMFVAEQGKGTYVGGKRVFVSKDVDLQHSLVAGGFPTEHTQKLPLALRQLTAVAPHVRNVRALGSAALHLAYIASGRLSGYWEPNLQPWDVAAGVLLVQEAGGKVTALSGEPYRLTTRDVLATNSHVHEELLRILSRIV